MTIAINNLLNLSDHGALVTGAGGNIGSAIAGRLAEAGARVAAHYRTSRQAVDALVDQFGDKILPIQADLTDANDRDRLLSELNAAGFTVTACVHNAADQSIGGLADLSLRDWRAMLDANLDSVFALTQALLPTLDGGTIVNISSIEGADPAPGHGHYAASKAALNMLTRSLALETAGRNIRVNTVSPGLIRRDGIEEQWPEGVARWQQSAPLERLGEASDIANAVLFLVSPAASWISGANLVVDGGVSARPRW